MSDDGGDDGYDDDDDDDGGEGGGGGSRALRRGSRGPAVAMLQQQLRAAGFDPIEIDGRFGPHTERAVRAFQRARGLQEDGVAGHQTRGELERPRPAPPSFAGGGSSAWGAPASPTFTMPDLSGGGSSSGGCGTLIFWGFGLLVAGYAVFWFVTVVLPILLMIAAAGFALWVAVKLFRASVARYGPEATLKGLGLLVAVGVGGPLLFLGYRALFMGDFEAARQGVVLRVEPSGASAACREPLSDGDNLDCTGDRCQTSDTLEGRWVAVAARDGSRCWASYRDVRFQHGIVMSLVGLVIPLRATEGEDAEALAAQRAALERRTAALAGRGDWPAVAALAAPILAANVPVPASAAARLEEGLSRSRYVETLAALASARPEARGALLAYARALPSPGDKPEVAALAARWRREACEAALQATRGAGTTVTASLRMLAAAAPSCDPDLSASLDAAVAALLERVAADAAATPERRALWLDALDALPSLGERLSEGTRRRLTTALDAARQAQAAERQALLTTPRGAAPERVLAARCASVPGGPAGGDRAVTRLVRAAERDVRRDAATYARALAGGDLVTATLREASFLEGAGKPAARAIAAGDRGWRAGEVALDRCGERATLAYERPATRRSPAGRTTLSLCFHPLASRWDPCSPLAGGAR